jgi:hypothetical protein
MEHRIFNTQQDITRFRNRVGLRYDLTAKMKFSIYDELLLNITGNPFLDHNRLGINLEYKLMPHLKFDMGYIHIARMPKTSLYKLQENNVFLNLTYQLPKHTTKVRTDNWEICILQPNDRKDILRQHKTYTASKDPK